MTTMSGKTCEVEAPPAVNSRASVGRRQVDVGAVVGVLLARVGEALADELAHGDLELEAARLLAAAPRRRGFAPGREAALVLGGEEPEVAELRPHEQREEGRREEDRDRDADLRRPVEAAQDLPVGPSAEVAAGGEEDRGERDHQPGERDDAERRGLRVVADDQRLLRRRCVRGLDLRAVDRGGQRRRCRGRGLRCGGRCFFGGLGGRRLRRGLGGRRLGGRSLRGRRGAGAAFDLRARGGAVGEPELVDRGEVRLVGGHVGLFEDGGHGAGRLASAAVDAGDRVDVEYPVRTLFVVDAVDRADLDAGLVLDVDARLGDDERHRARLPPPRAPRPRGLRRNRSRGPSERLRARAPASVCRRRTGAAVAWGPALGESSAVPSR